MPRVVGSAIALLGAYQIGLGLYFAALRPPLLPEDARFIGPPQPPGLAPWLDLVFTVMGGQMAAVGFLLCALAVRRLGAPSRSRLEIFATFTNAKSPRSLRPTWMRINYLDPELNRVELFSHIA